jgi:hypothetical protein
VSIDLDGLSVGDLAERIARGARAAAHLRNSGEADLARGAAFLLRRDVEELVRRLDEESSAARTRAS